MKFVGKYRVKANLDLETNDIPRDEHGIIDPDFDDIYIKCAKNAQIYHYGDDVLVAYVPSLGRLQNQFLRNILSNEEQYKDINFKSDMKKKMLKGKEYIHSIGAWDKYLKYLQQEL